MTRPIVAALMASIIIVVLASGCIGLLGYYRSDQLGPVGGLEAEPNSVYIALSWDELEGASLYNLYRDGTMIAQTGAASYKDPMVEHGQEYSYKVAGVREANAMFDTEGAHSQEVIASLDTLTNDDAGFVPFVDLSSEIIEDTIDGIERAALSYLLSEARERASVLEILSQRYLDRTGEFVLTETMEPARAHYILALENFTMAGQHFGEGAASLDAELIDLGRDYVEVGNAHLEAVRGILP